MGLRRDEVDGAGPPSGGATGTRQAVRRAGGDLVHAGNTWARRVKLAERALRRADNGADHPSGELRSELADARRDDAALRAALLRLEAELAACPTPEADWARRARTEAERTRAGLAGEPDPHPDGRGLRSGWGGLTPLVRNGLIAWLALAVIAITALLLGEG